MRRSRFVKPAVTVIPLSDGDSITVKSRLNHGEQADAHARMYTEASPDGTVSVDRRRVSDAIILAYLVDWTFCDSEGELVPIRGVSAEELDATLRSLDPFDWIELRDAIMAHDVAVAQARASEKKSPAGELALPATSPSVG